MSGAGKLYPIAVAMAAGVLAGEVLSHEPVVLVLLWLATAGALWWGAVRRNDPARVGAVVAAALLFGWALAGSRLESLERTALGREARKGADAVLHGRVLGDGRSVDGVLRFRLGVARATVGGRSLRVRERVLVVVRPPPPVRLGAGDGVRVEARLAPVSMRSADPGIRRAARRLVRDGVAARGYVRPDGLKRLTGPSAPLDVIGRAGRAAVTRPAARLPPREGGLLLGVTVGDTSLLDPKVEADFRATGLTHLLAVSGGNVVMFLGALSVILHLFRARRGVSVAVLALALLAFMAVTRFEPSVLRAGAMGAVGLLGVALGSRREGLTALAAAAIALMALDPFIVHTIGFQLSALATLGILVLGPRLNAAFPGRIGGAFAVTLSAQLAVAPLIALTFHSVSLVALVANVLVVPAVGPATILGLAGAAAGSLWSGFGVACATLARPFLVWMASVAGLFARAPYASIGTPAGVLGGLVVCGLLVLAIRAARIRRPPRAATVMIVAGVLVAANVWAVALTAGGPSGLEVTALDVGQGDAILVRAPGGATMLVDGGPDPRRLMERLASRRIRRIDVVVLTHPHADHVIGLTAAVAQLPVGSVLDPDLEAEIPEYAALLATATRRRIPRVVARAGHAFALGPVGVEVLAPREPLFLGTDSDLNNNSIVLRLTFGKGSALLGGELQEEGQQRLLEEDRDAVRATVFKVPHHGSARMLDEFYAATGSRAALIPVGPNDFGHPSKKCLDALAGAGIIAYRTDRSGDVTAVVDASGNLRIRQEHRVARAA